MFQIRVGNIHIQSRHRHELSPDLSVTPEQGPLMLRLDLLEQEELRSSSPEEKHHLRRVEVLVLECQTPIVGTHLVPFMNGGTTNRVCSCRGSVPDLHITLMRQVKRDNIIQNFETEAKSHPAPFDGLTNLNPSGEEDHFQVLWLCFLHPRRSGRSRTSKSPLGVVRSSRSPTYSCRLSDSHLQTLLCSNSSLILDKSLVPNGPGTVSPSSVRSNTQEIIYQAPRWSHLPILVLEAETLSDFS